MKILVCLRTYKKPTYQKFDSYCNLLFVSFVKYDVLYSALPAYLLFGGKLTVLGIVSNHIFKGCYKVRNQLDGLSRLRKFLSFSLGSEVGCTKDE